MSHAQTTTNHERGALSPDEASAYADTWNTYTSAWKATSTQAKAAALRASTSTTCEYRDPLAHTAGHDALIEYMRSFHAQMPGGYFETTYFLAHHNRSISKWNMCAGDGTIVGEGISYGEYDEQGKLQSMNGFFETPNA